MIVFTSLSDPQLAAMLRDGAVGVLPTDTIYGLVASSYNSKAVERLYALKHREQKPGTSIAASAEQLIDLGLPQELIERVSYLWPNPVSVIIPHDLEYIHQGRGDSPFRVVADETLASLLHQTGPLTTSSANAPGEPPAQTLAEAQAYFGDNVDFYVDGGPIIDRPASTIVGISDAGVTVYREGAIKLNDRGQIV